MHVYSSDDNRASALGMIAVLAVLLAVAMSAVMSKLGVGPPWLFSAPTVAAAYGLLYKAMDGFAWRWSILHRLGLIQVPIVDGTYEGQLVSSYQQRTLPVRIRVDQSWTQISISFSVLEPASSTSYSLTASLERQGHLDARLTYTFRNQTRPGIADADMHDHDGTAEVVVCPTSGEMRGRYFNFRGSQGTLALIRK